MKVISRIKGLPSVYDVPKDNYLMSAPRAFLITCLFVGTPLHSNGRERTLFAETVRNRNTTRMQRQKLEPLQL